MEKYRNNSHQRLSVEMRDVLQFRITTSYEQATCSMSLHDSNSVIYKRKPLYLQNFVDADIFQHEQLLDNNKNYLGFDDLSSKFQICTNTQSLRDYVKLFLAIPERWESTSSLSVKHNNADIDFFMKLNKMLNMCGLHQKMFI